MIDIASYALVRAPYKRDLETIQNDIDELRDNIKNTNNSQYIDSDFQVTYKNPTGIFQIGDIIPQNTSIEDVIKGMLIEEILPTINISMTGNSINKKGATLNTVITFTIVPPNNSTIKLNNAVLYVNNTQIKIFDSVLQNTQYSYSLNITSDSIIQVKLSLVNSIGIVKTMDSKKLYFYFRNPCYIGASTEITDNSYTSVLKEYYYQTLPTTITFDTSNDKYMYLFIPKSFALEIKNFIAFGLYGGIEKINECDITNSYNNTETYYVYRSDNYGLGMVTITIEK